jgi:hypothetical protein
MEGWLGNRKADETDPLADLIHCFGVTPGMPPAVLWRPRWNR